MLRMKTPQAFALPTGRYSDRPADLATGRRRSSLGTRAEAQTLVVCCETNSIRIHPNMPGGFSARNVPRRAEMKIRTGVQWRAAGDVEGVQIGTPQPASMSIEQL